MPHFCQELAEVGFLRQEPNAPPESHKETQWPPEQGKVRHREGASCGAISVRNLAFFRASEQIKEMKERGELSFSLPFWPRRVISG